MPSPGIITASSTRAVGTRCAEPSATESDGGTRLFFPSTDPGREVHQPNVAVGHGRAPLRASGPRGPRPASRLSSRAPPRCSPRPPLSHLYSAVYSNTHSFMVVPRKFDSNASTGLELAQSTAAIRRWPLESVREHHAGLHSFRNMRRMEARRRKARALWLRHSQSLASRRQRPSQAKVRSTIQRLGSATKPVA